MLTQWHLPPSLTRTVGSRHCSHMRIPVHSPWLPGYIDVTQTILVLLTMAGLFSDGPHVPLFKVYNVWIVYTYILKMISTGALANTSIM